MHGSDNDSSDTPQGTDAPSQASSTSAATPPKAEHVAEPSQSPRVQGSSGAKSGSIPGHIAVATFFGLAALVGAMVLWMGAGKRHSSAIRGSESGQTSDDPYSQGPVRISDVGDSLEEELEPQHGSRGLGELRAKKPGETKERADAVRLIRHHVRARIVGAVAKTEVDEVFRNDTNDVLEGIFRFPLPADAQIERLALEVDGKLVEGAFTDRERAAAIWRGSIVQAAPQMRAQIKDEIIWVPGPWRDPALLEWQRGNRFELRIYPIPKQGSRRIVLSYTQIVPGTVARRWYSYPLPKPTRETSTVDDFSIDLELRGHDPRRPPTVSGYESKISQQSDDTARLRIDQQRFLPRGDLRLEYAMPNANKALIAWAHQPSNGEQPYLAMLLRPQLPIARDRTQNAYAIVVDTSRSMFGENLKRAVTLTRKMVSQMSADDRVTLLACDSECRIWPEGALAGGRATADAARGWLASQTAEGASDITGAVEAATEALERGDSDRAKHVVYVGDGTATAGPTRSATISAELRRVFGSRHVDLTAVAVGSDTDLEGLRTVARGGHGVVVPYLPGTSMARVADLALGSTQGMRLESATLELPPGAESVAPRQLNTIAEGDEVLVVARLSYPELHGEMVLRGSIQDSPFEQKYPLDVKAIAGESNGFVPRLWAANRILDLERSGDVEARREAIELSSRFSVASRYTSLLVLESQAMFDAFGLDNRRKVATWSGELEDSASAADAPAEESESSAAAQPANDSEALGTVGSAPAPARAKASGAGLPSEMAAAASPMMAPVPAPAAPAPAARKRAEARPEEAAQGRPRDELQIAADSWLESPPRPRRRLIPMRRVWERKGEVLTGRNLPSNASPEKVAAAELELQQNPDRRNLTKKLLDLYMRAGEVDRAQALANRWSERDPLDVEALVARADLAARRGNRTLAIRILGSVLDVRPSDVGAQQRLNRLMRWMGQPRVACRFVTALAEFHPADEKALADALRCLGDLDQVEIAQQLRLAASERVLNSAERLLQKPRPQEALSGDIRVTATWHGGDPADVDLSLIDPDAHRISWLGAPSRAVISAVDSVAATSEGLALRGGKPGEYVLEVVRSGGHGTVSGTVSVQIAGTHAQIPFSLDGERRVLAILKLTMVPRLIPLTGESQPVRTL